MEQLKQQVVDLSDEDWRAFHAWVINDESWRRERGWLRDEGREEGRVEVVEELIDSGSVSGPAHITLEQYLAGEEAPEWVDPLTIHRDMYLIGWVISRAGRVWESTHRGLNHWEPGTVGVDSRIWRDVTDLRPPVVSDPPGGESPGDSPAEPESPVESVAEYHVGRDYAAGDRFTWQGRTYEVVQAHTSAAHWPPDAAHSLYKEVA